MSFSFQWRDNGAMDHGAACDFGENYSDIDDECTVGASEAGAQWRRDSRDKNASGASKGDSASVLVH
eukprot:SAG22_NODE_11014_length_505_cov_0.763547_2_plen_67_part_00